MKCRCRKWARMSHLDICSTSYVKKKGWDSKLAISLPTTKIWESTRLQCVQVECDIPLESSWRGVQLCFRPCHDRRYTQEVMRPQSHESPNCWNFGTRTWKSWDKRPLGCGPHGELQSILYGGRWCLPPSLSRGESCESKSPLACPSTKGTPKSVLTNLWLVECKFEWVIEKLVILPSPNLGALARTSTPSSVESWERASSS